MISRVCSTLVDWLSRSLEAGEQTAVLGDLAESDERGAQALRDVFGLVARRQIGEWRQPTPWVALFGLVLPFGLLFGAFSLWVADFSASVLNSAQWDAGEFFAFFLGWGNWNWLTPVMLASWSWSVGFAIGCVSRRAAPIHGLLFAMALLAGTLSLELSQRLRTDPHFAALFDFAFYRYILPAIVQALFVLLPSIWGMRESLAIGELKPNIRGFATAATLLTLAAISAQMCVWLEFPSAFGQPGLWDGWPGQVFRLLALWPALYWLALARRKAIT